jgi:IclR family transcriptional regulator, KDG regulon repressor
MSIQSVSRALNILSLFTYEQPRLGVTEISRAMGLAKPTVHGLIQTMVESEFLSQDPETRKYCLGKKLYELGTVFTSNIKINQVGAMTAQQLAAKLGLSVSLATWENGSVMMTFRGVSKYRNLQPQQLAPRFPAYCSSLGKAILSSLKEELLSEYLDDTQLVAYTHNTISSKEGLLDDLRQTRERGYAVDREEFIIGMSCMGAAILDNTGYPTGAISISGTREQIFGKKENQLTADLMETAMDISYKMGYLPQVQKETVSF